MNTAPASMAESVSTQCEIPDAISSRLRACSALPTLPGVAVRLMELGRQPEVDFNHLADAVSCDPALSAKILRIANSPFYARRRAVGNLRQALMVLGLDAAISLCLTFTLVGTLRDPKKSSDDHKLYWRRSLLSAISARVLGSTMEVGQLDELFLAGLLQDIGMLALHKLEPDGYPLLAGMATSHNELSALEIETFGTSHASVGAWLLATWELPDYLQMSVLMSHITEPDAPWGADSLFSRCVSTAGLLADIWIDSDKADRTELAASTAESLLGLDRNSFSKVLDGVSDLIPEISSVFEIELDTEAQLLETLDQAKELLFLRGLHISQKAAAAREQAEESEARARNLEEKSRRDGLTGVFNRAHLDKVLADEFRASTTHGWPLTVAFIDLDHFKVVNDSYGHQAGDQVLAHLANYLSSNVRSTDFVARYGGDEFLLLLPGTSAFDSERLLQRLAKAISHETVVLHDGHQVCITISVGLATHARDSSFEDEEAFLRAADHSLYTAKRGGRNSVVGPPST